MEWAVSLVPTPAMTVARSPTASITASSTACCSPSLMVGDYPVVPRTTRPAWDCRSPRCAASSWAPATSIDPSSASGVTIAVSTRPKGRAGSGVMSRIYRPARGTVRARPRGESALADVGARGHLGAVGQPADPEVLEGVRRHPLQLPQARDGQLADL